MELSFKVSITSLICIAWCILFLQIDNKYSDVFFAVLTIVACAVFLGSTTVAILAGVWL